MTAGRTIDYETLAQDAMRGVVRTVLTEVAASGLPGEHHFYVSFDTTHPGISLSKRLKEKYPDEMTIVLQHRFWDLNVTEDRFEVKLTFDGIPERLVVPFAAIKVFFDPSVRYGLQFEELDQEGVGAAGHRDPDVDQRPTTVRSAAKSKPRVQRKPRAEKGGEPGAVPSVIGPTAVKPSPPAQIKPSAVPSLSGASSGAVSGPPQASEPATAPAGAKVVSLSDFRKK